MKYLGGALVVLSVLSGSRLAIAQSREPIGENLVAEGIPPLPGALAETADRYVQFRGATLLDWHPAKRQILISTRFADTDQVHEVKFPGGARTQLTFFKDRAASAAYQPTAGDSFVFSKDVGGNE